MNLYKVTTSGIGCFYVISTDFTSASDIVKSTLDKADYGFTHKREVKEIELVTKEIMNYSIGKKEPYITDENRLIIQKKEEVQ